MLLALPMLRPLAAVRALALCAAALGAAACGDAPPARAGLRSVATFGGAELGVPESARRIVPANAAALEFLLALVEPERIAAAPLPAFEYSALRLERAAWEGRTFASYTGEEVLALDPDLIVTHDWQNPETSLLLEQVGLPVLRLPSVASFADIEAIVDVLGRALGVEPKAREVLAGLRARRDALGRRRGEPVSAVSYTNFGAGGWCAGRGTSIDLAFELAGIENAAARAGRTGHTEIDFETLLALDPDVLVVGSSAADEAHSPTADYLRAEPRLAELRAVRADRILVLPARLFSTNSQYVLDAAERLCAELEPARAGE